jgi:SPP1 gp7 family putative phage head morphogenesis protein
VADSPDIFNLPFREAIDALRRRLRMPKSTFLQLDKANRSRSFTVAWVAQTELLGQIHQALLDSMQKGQSLRDFRNALPEMLNREGWTGDNWWHAEVVYNQNRNMAYGAGRYQQMQEAGLDHWQFAANTDRHAALDGQIFRMTDRRFYPPVPGDGWNCQCTAEPVFEDEFRPEDVTTSDAVSRRTGYDPPITKTSFDWDPASYLTGPSVRMSNVPAELRGRIQRLARQQGIGVSE